MTLRRSEVDSLVLEACMDARPAANGWSRANCPLCVYYGEPSEDKRQSFGIRSDGKWHCFRCGAFGFSGEGDSGPAMDSTPDFMEPPDSFVALASSEGQRSIALEPARRYVASRRVDMPVLERTGLGACSSGKFAGRIVCPVFEDSNTYWLGFVSRVWLGGAALKKAQSDMEAAGGAFRKYLYPNWPGRGRLVYNQVALRESTETPILAGEGVFDMFSYLPDAVAFLGKPSPDQLVLLLRSPRPCCFVLDGDSWKQARALTLWMRLHGKASGYIRLPPKVDPDEVNPHELVEAAKRSISADIEI